MQSFMQASLTDRVVGLSMGLQKLFPNDKEVVVKTILTSLHNKHCMTEEVNSATAKHDCVSFLRVR